MLSVCLCVSLRQSVRDEAFLAPAVIKSWRRDLQITRPETKQFCVGLIYFLFCFVSEF